MASDEEALLVKRARENEIIDLDTRVLAVGLGGKVENGRPTGELAIWVIVYGDPQPGLRPIRSVIRSEYDGVKTHIVEVTKRQTEPQSKLVTSGSRIRAYPSVIIPGIDKYIGTLGIAARTEGVPPDKRPNVFLSCHHVMGETKGDRVVQLSCSNCCEPDVAKVLRGDPKVDAAIATINDDWEVQEGKIDNVVLAGTVHLNPGPQWSTLPPDVQMALKHVNYEVYKYGAETGWTKGLVGCVEVYGRQGQYFGTTVAPHILISSTGKDAEAFSAGGDSGSMVIDGKRRVVALLTGGATTLDEIGLTWAVPIKYVEERLKIRIAATPPPSIWGATVTSPLGQTHRALAGTASGRGLLDLYGRHESEVRKLLRESRRFVVAWHHGQGPELVRALAAVAERQAEVLPTEVAGRSWADHVSAVVQALRALGSPALVRDVDRMAPFLVSLGGRTYGQLMDLIEGLDVDSTAGIRPGGAPG